VDFFHAVDEESRWKVVHIALGKSGVSTTLWTGEWLVETFSQGKTMDTPFTVVVAARKDLWLSVVLMTDGTSDFFLEIFHSFLYSVLVFCHDSLSLKTREEAT